MKVKSYSLALTPEQAAKLAALLEKGNYVKTKVPYTTVSVRADNVSVNLYASGKVLVQGDGTEEFVTFVLEPQVTGEARLGYEDVLDPGALAPHIGVDESGKGDYFGPLVIAAAYTNETLGPRMRQLGAKDCKVLSDAQVLSIGSQLRALLGANRYAIVSIGPEKYNEIYAKRKNGNVILAWGHARAIENVLARVPSCPRVVADQFGNESLIQRALLERGRQVALEQHHKAEADIAVAAASIIAREHFLKALAALGKEHGVALPKGAAHATTLPAAKSLVAKGGEALLKKVAKINFRTTDLALGREPAPARKWNGGGHRKSDIMKPT
ncbi:MAG: ribonuclease HIII [Kiritimatiellae bacterium]|nr:ribonuclease HIII [Kiritimatiellia bacterium]